MRQHTRTHTGMERESRHARTLMHTYTQEWVHTRAEQGHIRDVAGQVRHAIFFMYIYKSRCRSCRNLGRIKAVRFVCVYVISGKCARDLTHTIAYTPTHTHSHITAPTPTTYTLAHQHTYKHACTITQAHLLLHTYILHVKTHATKTGKAREHAQSHTHAHTPAHTARHPRAQDTHKHTNTLTNTHARTST